MSSVLGTLRVIEQGEGVMVPYCGRLFAELGAEVVKIERPVVGDSLRYRPPYIAGESGAERSGLFRALNLGKRSITLDTTRIPGRAIMRRLLADADVLVTSVAGEGARAELAALRAEFPKLVIVNLTPFGTETAYPAWAATEIVTFNMGGLGYISPMASGRPEAPPLKSAGNQSELQAAINGSVGAMAALRRRRTTGEGGLVDVCAQESIILVQEANTTSYTYEGVVRERSAPWLHQPVGLFPCKDGSVFIFIIGDRRWPELVQAMGTPEWTTFEVFKDGPSRALYFDALFPLMAEWTMRFTKRELYELLQAAKVPSSMFMEIPDIFSSAQLQARGYWREIEDEDGTHRYAGPPFTLIGREKNMAPAPLLGADTPDVLATVGFTPAEIEEFLVAGVI